MARKSRKKNINPAENMKLSPPENTSGIPTAIYARLSDENNGRETDDSLQTQIELAREYINYHEGFQLIDIYADNGFSGMNFDRPEFDRLMNDVRSGKISCIVVKDLSRFGRNYVEAGYYLENIFPYLKVRFIAVNDEFDNSRAEDMESLAVPLKNIINGMFAKEVSQKLLSVFGMKQRRGDIPSGDPPYGYKFDAERENYHIDEEKAKTVSVMYTWLLMGKTAPEITKRLNFLQVSAPGKRRKNDGTNKPPIWWEATVRNILTSPTYAGDMALGKEKTEAYKGVKYHKLDRSEWLIFRDHHDAAILRADFDAVQDILLSNKRTKPRSPSDALSGKVYCGCCGKPMRLDKKDHGKGRIYGVYQCPSPQKNMPVGCHSIKENLLKVLVMDQIKLLIKTVCDKKEIVQRLIEEEDGNDKIASLKKSMNSLLYRKDQVDERMEKLYTDYTEGLLEDEEFQFLKEQYILDGQKLDNEFNEASQRVQRIEKNARIMEKQIQHLEQFLDTQEYNDSLVQELIEAVYVGSDNTLEVQFKCNDVYAEFLENLGVAEDGE